MRNKQIADIDDGRKKKKFQYSSSLQQQPRTLLDSGPAGQSEDFSTGQKKKDYWVPTSSSSPRVRPIKSTYWKASSVEAHPLTPCFQKYLLKVCGWSSGLQFKTTFTGIWQALYSPWQATHLKEWTLLPPTDHHLCNLLTYSPTSPLPSCLLPFHIPIDKEILNFSLAFTSLAS